MPPLKKSYSDQARNPKRPQWQRTNSHPNAQTTAPKPLVPVSKSTRNKLQAFQFAPPKSGLDEKIPEPAKTSNENEAPPGPPKATPRAPSAMGSAVTPVARLAWQDLLGVPEMEKEDEDASPSERIMWRNDPRAASNTSMSPMLSRKGRKRRARSSSPVSSPATSRTPASNPKHLAHGPNAPHADPALELWDRGTTGIMNPLLARMMVSSSPRPPKTDGTPGSERSLRKSISCGSNWPKRRRIERLDVDHSAVSQDNERSTTKSSLVSALLQTVDGEIRKSNTSVEASIEAQEEQHSSPSRRRSPRRSRAEAQQSSRPSPIQEAAEHNQPAPQSSSSSTIYEAANEVAKQTATRAPSDYGDDFGDDDFDEDTLMELDAIANQPIQGDDTTFVAAEEPHPPVTTPHVPKTIADDEFDEFGDLDDDLFDGAEDLVAEVESKYVSQIAHQGKLPNTPPKPKMGEEEGDPYGLGDDFGDDFDLEAIELAATHSARASALAHTSQKPRAIQRYLITNVLESYYTDGRGREFPEKLLLVQVDRTNQTKTIHLRDDWYDTEAHNKAFVHVIGDFESSGRCIVDNNQNMLILHPDQLISATVLADSFMCMRRAVLQDRVKATGEASPPLVYGTVLHEIFQEALMENNWESRFLGNLVTKTLDKHIEDLYIIKVGMDDARAHVLSKIPEVQTWAKTFVSARPRPEAFAQGRNGEKVNMCVSKLLDVEEHVWSPMYGLKGNIDATVQVTMQDKSGSKTLTVPFEVKTGKSVSSTHHAQTLLYNLLLSDRYDVEIVYGILYYMETSQTLRVPAIQQELRHMIMQRNRLACYIRERSVTLPPMKRDKFACSKCYAQTTCFVYHKLADDGTGETSGMNDKFDEVVQHLAPVHKEFFLKWEDLLTKEEKESMKHRRELWTMLSTERERLGRCLANVIIEDGSASEDKQSSKINRFFYTFVKETHASSFSFLDSQLAVGEPIVVSDEKGHFALAIGYVTAVRKYKISVAVDRRLHNARTRQRGFDEVDNQVFASIMEVGTGNSKPKQSQDEPMQAPVRYRVDKDEFSNGMATVRNNLVRAMANDPSGSGEIRRLVVDLFPPMFKSAAAQTQYTISDKDELNMDQKAAIRKVMSAKDYALVLGMPGTGKTTTIAHIIRALISQGKTILLTSYTHSAVDNILLKLKRENVPILRLGAPAKVHPEVKEFVTLASQPMSSFEEIRKAWHDSPIVATTCLGINHPLFNERKFDYCIVDEASQITLPVCLGPIRMAKTFVLVGDHNQLPPLVQNEEARLGGLDISLFKLLSDTHPDSVVNLEHQYRMSEDIMTLSNTLIYQGRLKCGTESLRHAVLDIPNLNDGLRQRHFDASSFISLSQQRSPSKAAGGAYCTSPQKTRPAPSATSLCRGPRPGTCWLRDLLDPTARVRFVNTDALADSREQAKGNRIVNPCEARVVAQLVDALLATGVPAAEIGVMTHYRSQLAQLKYLLRNHTANGQAIEMHTADRFQGRDKAVIVLSLVRNNENCSIGELLKDWRRINVAFTRAKTKLLVVGSRSTLGGCGEEEMLARFIGLMEDREWVYDLREGMLDAHWFPEGGEMGTQGLSPVKGAGVKIKMEKGEERVLGRSPLSGKGKGKEGKKGKAEPRRVGVGERVLMKKPVLRDVLNDLMY